MTSKTPPRDAAGNDPAPGSPFPLPPAAPLPADRFETVHAAAVYVAEVPFQMSCDCAARVGGLARLILEQFPHEGDSVQDAAMHAVGRVLEQLGGVIIAVED